MKRGMRLVMVVWVLGVVGSASQKCKLNVAMVGFDMQKCLGTWYSVSGYNYELAKKGGWKCQQLNYTEGPEEGVYTATKDVNFVNKEGSEKVEYKLEEVSSGKFNVTTITDTEDEQEGKHFNLWFLATDYNTFAVVYSCTQQPDGSYLEWANVNVRERVFKPRLNLVIAGLGLDPSKFLPLENTGCTN